MLRREVVVVEDDPGLRLALEKVLGVGGYRPVVFESAEALLETDAEDEAGCLVLDIRLPGMTGLELYRTLDARRPAPPPAIFMTAYDDPDVRTEAERLGQYLVKPFRGRELLEAVAQALGVGAAS